MNLENPLLQKIQPTAGAPAGVLLAETDPSGQAGSRLTSIPGLITQAAGAPTGATPTVPPQYIDTTTGVLYWHDGAAWLRQEIIFPVDNVNDLTLLSTPINGALYQTKGYYIHEDGGANLYRYVGSSSQVCDGLFILDGIGGDNTPGATAATYPGTGTGRFIATDQSVANAKQAGAVGDGVTDDIFRLRAASLAVQDLGINDALGLLRVPHSSGGYRITDTWAMTGCDVKMDGRIIYDGPDDRPAVVYGDAADSQSRKRLEFRVERIAIGAWTNPDAVGIRLIRLATCDVNVFQVSGFTVGLHCLGEVGGFVYNKINLGYIFTNGTGVKLESKGAGPGYVNENLFIGGRISVNSALVSGRDRYGIHITSADGIYVSNNNNVFIKPSLEIDAPGAAPDEAIPIWIEHGFANKFHDVRFETGGVYSARISNASAANFLDAGYGSTTWTTNIDDLSTVKDSIILNGLRRWDNDRTPIWSSRYLPDNWAPFNSGQTTTHIVGLEASQSGVHRADFSLAAINADYLEMASTFAAGRFVSTSRKKRFVVGRSAEVGFGGRVIIQCYDVSGVLLDNTGGDLVFGPQTMTYHAGSLGWRTASDSNDAVMFTVASTVAKVFIGLAGGTANLRLKSMQIYSLDGADYVSTWIDFPQWEHERHSQVVPTIGTWAVGDKVYNRLPAASAKIGWVCVTAGTPGTWKPFGAIDA